MATLNLAVGNAAAMLKIERPGISASRHLTTSHDRFRHEHRTQRSTWSSSILRVTLLLHRDDNEFALLNPNTGFDDFMMIVKFRADRDHEDYENDFDYIKAAPTARELQFA